jgi:hypothetical protein
MSTYRIGIYNEDLGVSAPTGDIATTGYIVIEAPKGPIKPVLIPQGRIDLIEEYFGYPSATYPQIQEAMDFNAEFPIWISAPYDTTGSNEAQVAYITPGGVFPTASGVDLTDVTLEEIQNDEVSVEGISSFTSDPAVLVPVGKSSTLFNAGADVAAASILSYSTGVLSINLGFDIDPVAGELLDTTATSHQFLNTNGADPATGMVMQKPADTPNGGLVIDIPGVGLMELWLSIVGSTIEITDPNGLKIATLPAGAMTSVDIDDAEGGTDKGSLTGDYATYFSSTAMTNIWSVQAFRDTVKVYWKADLDKDAIFGTMYQKYLSTRMTSITFAEGVIGNQLKFTVSESKTPTTSASRTITGSLKNGDTDSFGADITFAAVLTDQGIIDVAPIKEFDGSTVYSYDGSTTAPTMTMPMVHLSRAVRTSGNTEGGWTEASDPLYEPVDIFINPENGSSSAGFYGLSATQTLSRFIASKSITPAAVDAGLTQLVDGQNYFITTNLFNRKGSYSNEVFTSNLSGRYATMIGRILDQKLGGAAPMYVNAQNLGGQIGSNGIVSPQYRFTPAQLEALDKANYNPIVSDPSFGVMVTSQKTAKGGESTDWSYIGHTSAFLRFQRTIRDEVMVPQIGKPNNPTYRELRLTQIRGLFRPRVEGTGRIWAGATAEVDSSPDVLAQRRFVIKVRVKVDIFSEGVDLYFTNVDQTTTLG